VILERKKINPIHSLIQEYGRHNLDRRKLGTICWRGTTYRDKNQGEIG